MRHALFGAQPTNEPAAGEVPDLTWIKRSECLHADRPLGDVKIGRTIAEPLYPAAIGDDDLPAAHHQSFIGQLLDRS